MAREVPFKETTCSGCGKTIRRRAVHKYRWCEDCKKAGLDAKKEVGVARDRRTKVDAAMVIDVTDREQVIAALASTQDKRRDREAQIIGLRVEIAHLKKVERGLSYLLGDEVAPEELADESMADDSANAGTEEK